MVMNRAHFRRQLQLGLNTTFGLEYRRYPEEWRDGFDVETSEKAYEEDVLLSGFGAAPVKKEGAAVSYDNGQEAWVARYVHETIALAFAITEEAEDDGLYGKLGAKYSRALARSLQHTKEVKGANVFNNGFSASFVGGDNKPLFATDHPLVGGGVLSNKLATPADLSETSLEDASIQISLFTDERGIPIAVQPETLLIPPQLRFIAHRILMSDKQSGTMNNDENALKAQRVYGRPRINHRFTDPDAWFIKTDAQDGLKHFVRKAVQRKLEGDFETGNMRYKATERYVFGWTDPRGAFGSEGGA